MTTTPGAQQNFTNTLLAITKLDEQAANDKVLRAYRQEQTQKALFAVQEAERQQQEKKTADEAASIFGPGGVTEKGTASPYAKGIIAQSGLPQLEARGATTKQELPTAGGGGEMTPSGYQLPGGIVRATPSPTDITGARQRIRSLADAPNLELYQNLVPGAGPGEPGYEMLSKSPFALNPEQVYKFVKERQEGEQRRAGALEGYAKIPQIEAQTEEAKARTRETTAKAGREEFALGMDQRYGEAIKQQELALKDAERRYKEGQILAQPGERRKTELETIKIGDEIKKLRRDAADHAEIQGLLQAYDKEPDEARRNQILGRMAAKQGHPTDIIRANTEAKQAYANITAKNVETLANIAPLAASNDPTKQAQAADLAAVHNQNALTAARIIETSPGYTGPPVPVRLKSVTPGGSGLMGTYPAKVGTTEVDTGVAQASVDKRLEDGARKGQPVDIGPGIDPRTGQRVNSRVLTPGQALATDVAIKHSYMKGDVDGLTRIINDSDAPPEVKADALQMLTKPNPLAKNVTTATEQPTPKGAEAPGLSVGGTVTGAGAAAVKGLGKLAPYSPMGLSRKLRSEEP